MRIRSASQSDLRSLVSLARALNAENPEHHRFGGEFDEARAAAKFEELLAAPLQDGTRTAVLVAVDESGACIGLLAVLAGAYAFSPQVLAGVIISYVRPGTDRTAVLQSLVARAEEWAKAHGADDIEFDVPPSMADAYAVVVPGGKVTPLVEKHLG